MSTQNKTQTTESAGIGNEAVGSLSFKRKGKTNSDSARQKTFSILKHYGHIGSAELRNRLYSIFGIITTRETVKKYREDYEKMHVGLVVVNPWNGWKNGTAKGKQYFSNGIKCKSASISRDGTITRKSSEAYRTPIFHALRIVLLGWWHNIPPGEKTIKADEINAHFL